MVSRSFKQLKNNIKDIDEFITNNKINLIPLPKNDKRPVIYRWNSRRYNLDENTEYLDKKGDKQIIAPLKNHYGNYGLLIGYKGNSEQDESIAVVDIDGYKDSTADDEEQARLKKESQKALFEDLQDLQGAMQVQTQSGGYHLYFWNRVEEESTSKTSHSLYYPKNFRIKELQGKNLRDSIEIFTKEQMKQVVTAGSTTRKGKYKVIGEINNLKDMATVEDLNQTVIDHLTAKGYEYRPATENTTNTINQNKKYSQEQTLKELTEDEIKQVVGLVKPIFNAVEGSKHKATLYLGGYFNYHISKDSTEKIAEEIIKEIGYLFENTEQFKRTLLESYEREVAIAGLPKLLKLIEELNTDFNGNKLSEELNSICNNKFSKKKIATATINKTEVPIYLFEDEFNKYLKYNNVIHDIDLILDLYNSVGSFIYMSGKIADTFKFKFKNDYIEFLKFNEVIEFLADKGITVPKHFEKEISSLKGLDINITKHNANSTNIKGDTDYITFGQNDKSYYTQTDRGIEYHYYKGDNEVTKTIANVIIKDITIVLDALTY